MSNESHEGGDSATGQAEPTPFIPREHSTPGLYPRFGEGTMLLGKKAIKFTSPDDVYPKVSLTNYNNICRD